MQEGVVDRKIVAMVDASEMIGIAVLEERLAVAASSQQGLDMGTSRPTSST